MKRLNLSLQSGEHIRYPRESWKPPRKALLGMVAALLLAATSLWGISLWRGGGLGGSESVAVLPFLNASQDSQVDYLSDGLAEGLIDQLSRVPGLKVIAWTSASRYKGPNPDLKAIAKDLGVKTILVGKIYQKPGGLGISVELAQADDGRHLWGQQFTRSADDLPSLQDSIATGVASVLGDATGKALVMAQNQSKTNGAAYQLYLKGRFYADRWTPEDVNRGISYFDQAIQVDPNFALAHVGKAYAYWGLSSQFVAPSEAMPKVKAEAEAALKIDPNLAEAHTALAVAKAVYDHDFPAAEQEFQTAIHLNPGSATAHEYFAYILLGQNRTADCKAQLETARKLDPLSAILETFAGWNEFWGTKDSNAAMVHLNKAVDLQPDFWWPYLFIAQIDAAKGHQDLANQALDKAKAAGGSTFVLGVQGYLAAKRGDRAEAQRLLKEILNAQSGPGYISPMHPAMIYAGLGDQADAMVWLKKAYDSRDEVCLVLNSDPTWDSLRQNPEFQALVSKIKLGR